MDREYRNRDDGCSHRGYLENHAVRGLLILARLQMVPRDIYETAKIDGVHPVRVFFKITLPLIRPALAVAVIFRMLDALRVFDLVYVLTANSAAAKTMSVISRENMIDFDNFAYGAAQSTLLFTIIAINF